MTIKLDRSKVCKILLMCDDTIAHYHYASVLENNTDIKVSLLDTMRMWEDIHDEIRHQLDEWDEKQKEKKK